MRCSTVRAWNRARVAVPVAAMAAGCVHLTSCGGTRRAGLEPEIARSADEPAACPRDAMVGPSGRCICESGLVQAMGACIEPTLGDTFCEPAARMTAEGCAFRACDEGQRIDLMTGECVSPASLSDGDSSCPEGAVDAVVSSRLVCLPSGAGCPRGTARPEGVSIRPICLRGANCPPGSLAEGATCKPVVFSMASHGSDMGSGRVVDLGAWTARAIGVDGGSGSPELCRPLEMRPDLFPVERGGALIPLEIEVTIFVPDQDITQVHASVSLRAPRAVSAQADSAARAAVDTLVELLRSLGGDASAASASARVRCSVGRL